MSGFWRPTGIVRRQYIIAIDDRVYHLPEDYDFTDRDEAFRRASEFGDKIPVGVIYKVEKETYEDKFDFIRDGDPLVDKKLNPKEGERLLKEFM